MRFHIEDNNLNRFVLVFVWNSIHQLNSILSLETEHTSHAIRKKNGLEISSICWWWQCPIASMRIEALSEYGIFRQFLASSILIKSAELLNIKRPHPIRFSRIKFIRVTNSKLEVILELWIARNVRIFYGVLLLLHGMVWCGYHWQTQSIQFCKHATPNNIGLISKLSSSIFRFFLYSQYRLCPIHILIGQNMWSVSSTFIIRIHVKWIWWLSTMKRLIAITMTSITFI